MHSHHTYLYISMLGKGVGFSIPLKPLTGYLYVTHHNSPTRYMGPVSPPGRAPIRLAARTRDTLVVGYFSIPLALHNTYIQVLGDSHVPLKYMVALTNAHARKHEFPVFVHSTPAITVTYHNP